MTAADTAPAQARPANKGFGYLRCPLCAEEAVIRLDLDDLEHLTCGSCDESFTLDDVRDMIARWQRVLNWIDACP